MKSPTTSRTRAAARGVKAPFRAWLVSAITVSVIAVTWSASGVGAAASPAARATPRPVGEFVSVSCLSASECMAVGRAPRTVNGIASTGALAEWWNGKRWTVEKTAVPLGADLIQVYAVSCAASNFCVMVGNYVDPNDNIFLMAEVWNGSTWTVAKTPRPKSTASPAVSSFGGVSCPRVDRCVAVGYYRPSAGPDEAFIETGGTSWAIATNKAPGGGGLDGVSCVSAAACMAVGDSENASATKVFNLAEVLTTTGWKVTTTPNGGSEENSLLGVSCTASAACVAVGVEGASTFALSLMDWDGKRWSLAKVSPPPRSNTSSFSSVSCVAATSCVTIGSYGTALSVLAAKWNGRTLKAIARPPTPPGGAIALLSAISCRTATWCEAVGSYRSGASPLAEVWNGKTWRIVDPTSTTQPK